VSQNADISLTIGRTWLNILERLVHDNEHLTVVTIDLGDVGVATVQMRLTELRLPDGTVLKT
jgi:hypothetical protein